MHRSLLFGVFFLFISTYLLAQPPGFTLLPVALDCASTFPLCDVDSTYNATDGTFNASVPPSFCGAGSVGNNAQWIQFYAGSSSITFHFDVSNCTVTGQGEGLQIAPWASDNCGSFTAIGACVASGGNPTPVYDVVASGMTPGFCYFLLMDGWNGSQCDYELTVTSGSTVPPPLNIGSISINMPPPYTTGCPINFSVNPQGDCVTTDWTTSGGFMNEDQYESTVTFSDPGSYTICFDAQYENTSCQPPVQECTTVSIIDPPHTYREETLCPGESITVGSQTFSSTIFTSVTVQNIAGCDSIIDLDLTVLGPNDLIENVDSTICKGDTVYIGPYPYYTPGNPHVIPLQSTFMSTLTGMFCDSTVRLTLSVLDPKADIDPTAGIPCSGDSITLTGVPNLPVFGQTQSFQWYYENVLIPGATNTTLNVADAGSYIFEVSMEKNGYECLATDTIDVTMSIAGVDANAGPDTMITCTVPNIQLQGSSTNVGNLQYFWTTDTGFIISGDMTLTPTISADGCYFLEIYDIDENCSGYDTVCVTADSGIPDIVLSQMDTVLTCNLTSTTLSGVGSSSGPGITYTWSGPGLPNGTENDPTITVNQSGTYTLDLLNTANGCPASGGLTVMIDTLGPISYAGPDTLLSCTDTLVPLISLGSSPYGGNYTYTWSGPGITAANMNDQFPLVAMDGTYQLLVENTLNGCSNTDDVIVGLSNDFPVSDAGAAQILNCLNNQIVQLDGANSNNGTGYTLEWSGPGITAGNVNQVSPNVTVEGEYYISVTNDSNGCSTSDTVVVSIDTMPPTPVVPVPGVIMCDPVEVTLDGSGSLPNGDITFAWSGPGINLSNQGSPTPTVMVDGDYFLTVTNNLNGCEEVNSVMVDIDTTTAVPMAIGDTLACDDLNVTLQGSADLANVSFYWVGPTGDTINAINPVVTAVGQYTLHVINNDNSCIQTTTAEVIPDTNAPNITVDGGNLDCDSLSTMITAYSDSIPVIYEWDINGGTMGANQIVTQPGTYVVTITNTDNNCTSSASIVVNQDNNNPQVNTSKDNEFDCDTHEVNLQANVTTGSGNYVYSWSTNDGTFISETNISSPTISQPGQYNVTVEDVENGCTTDAFIIVDENMTFPTPESINASNINCYSEGNGTIEINNVAGGIAPYTYSIDGGVNYSETPNFFLLDPGMYYIAIKDAFGCIYEDSVTVQEPQEFLIDLGPDFTINLGDSTELVLDINYPNTVASIVWSPSLDSCFTPDCTTLMVGPYEPTIYTVTVTDVNGCVATDQVQVNINKDRNVFIPTGFYPNSLTGNNIFMVYAEQGQIAIINKLMIFDRWGEKLFENNDFMPNDPDEGWNGTMDGKALNSGVFMYVVELEYIDGNKEFFKGDVTLVK